MILMYLLEQDFLADPYCRKWPYLYGQSGALTLGGGQESGRRPGTENVPYIVSLGKAAALLSDGETWKKNAAHMENCRERMIARISKRLNRSMFRINGPQMKYTVYQTH